MPKRDSAPIGAPCWVDLFTSDPDRARAFYSEIFGWTSESAGEEYGGYFNFAKDGIPVAGGMRNDGQAGTPDGWSIYLATDDVERVTKEAVANGGEVVVPAMDVMELGTMAVVSDPGHASIGAWKPGLHKGFGIFAEPGTPSWFELHTRAYDESVQFYKDVFEWKTQVGGRLTRVPLHDARRRRRGATRRHHGCVGVAPGRRTRRVVGLFRREQHRRDAGRDHEDGWCCGARRPRTRRTAGSQRLPTRPARCSSWSREPDFMPDWVR